MQRDPPLASSSQGSPFPWPTTPDLLTPAQIEFARLLGRILAERWDREHPADRSGSKSPSDRGPASREGRPTPRPKPKPGG